MKSANPTQIKTEFKQSENFLKVVWFSRWKKIMTISTQLFQPIEVILLSKLQLY